MPSPTDATTPTNAIPADARPHGLAGAIPAGSIPDGAIPAYAIPDGAIPDGATPHGRHLRRPANSQFSI
jgi:hypothetical protein